MYFQLTGDQLADLYRSFIKEYPVVSIEDGFDQDDWENWTKFKTTETIQTVGFVTSILLPNNVTKKHVNIFE